MKAFYKEILKSYYILRLDEDWDQQGAKKPSEKAFHNAHLFLFLMLNHIGHSLVVPDINPCPDGTIDVKFSKGPYRFLINIKDEGASCYGDDGNDGDRIKQKVIQTFEVIEWLKKHMT